ncbi:putative GMC oxidoreductase family protein [Lyophyllum shimeji]|uniref:GMC oxidoreductase family protein n=1 Tax=Lyophyllum shimeji TaxID=47721 RepID=A0A9P3PD61_LYOSH|nr:putative GMC oxidoreductase family protein [Lyophyllum shimeji]GLB33271.1 putative GMC oxidoreductase family protein [Lyophyllum shimeji]
MLAFTPSFTALVAAAAALVGYAQGAAAPAPADYLIVGGGTAGLVLANRLSEDPNVSVLVLEGGGDGLGNVNISDFRLVGAAWGTDIDWQFPTQPLKYANNRTLTPGPRGKVLGGSSAINGDVFDRGDAREYDQWEVLGNTGWNFNSLFPAGQKSEHFYPPPADSDIEYVLSHHGTTGNVATSYSRNAPPIHDAIISSVANSGGFKSSDLEGGNATGIAHVTNARLPSNDTRATSATAYYFPYSYRPNFQVILHATATRILWSSTDEENAVASGVEYVDQSGVTRTASGKTVVLSAGTWGSPPILERSGVGNATYLSSLGIKSVVDLPGVGENLSEQTLVPMQWQLNSSLPLGDVTPFLLNVESVQTTVGPANLATAESLLNAPPPNLSPALYDAHKRLYQNHTTWVEDYIAVSTPAEGPSVLVMYPVNLHPLSKGSVHIVSSNGLEYPKIEYNFFQNPFDLFLMAAGCARAQKIVSTPPLSDWVVAPIAPAANVTTIDALQDYVRANAAYTNHIIGTALMGPRQDGGVVDPNLKVYGTNNVYVVDASVIPIEPAAHLQGTVYAFAEHAASLFQQ